MPFPSNAQYLPILVNGAPLYDHTGDESPSSVDIVGDTTYPAAFFAYDGINVYFRLRMNQDPRNNKLTGFQNFAWGVLLNTTGVPGTYDWLFNVNGLNSTVNLIKNTTKLVNSWNDPAEGLGGGTPNFSQSISNYDFARVILADSNFGGNPDYFIDWFLPAPTFFSYLGINANSSISVIFFSSANGNNYNKDSLRTDEGFSFADALSDPTSPNNADVRAKLSASKVLNTGPTTLSLGQQGTWTGTLTVSNTGKSSATSVILLDTVNLDTISSFSVSGTPSQGTAVYNPSTKTLTWNIGNLSPGSSVSLNFSSTGLFSSPGTRSVDSAIASGNDNFTGQAIQSNTAESFVTVQANGSVAGKIISESNGLPLAGATVELLQGATVISTTLSDAAGQYSFSPAAPGSYTVRVTYPNYTVSNTSITVLSSQQTTQNVLLIPLPGIIQGTVTDNTSSPIQGAQVNLLNTAGALVSQTATDINGNYIFNNLNPQNFTVAVSKSSYQSQQKAVQLDPNETETLNFALQPSPATISGTISSTLGGTIGGATVEILNIGSQVIATATADINGFYSIDGIAPGSYRLRASQTNYSTGQIGFTAVAGTPQTVDLSLVPNPGALSGTVLDGSNQDPIPNTSIRIINNSGITVATARTDGSGTYSIPSLAPGSYTVVFTSDGYANKVTGAIISTGLITSLNVELDKLSGAVQGAISSTLGPLANAEISVTLNNIGVATTTSDSNGNYFVGNLSPNVYNIVVNASGYARQTAGVIVNAGATSTADFFMEQTLGTLQGIVADSASAPLSGAVVNIYQEGGSGNIIARIVTQSNGSYGVPTLPPGTYFIVAIKDGYQSMSMGAIITAGGTASVNFQLLSNPGNVTGTIFDADTMNPIEGAAIQIKVLDASGTIVQFTFSDSDGIYLLSNLAPGTYTLVASAPGYQNGLSSVVIPSNATVQLDISLFASPGSAFGRVFDNLTPAIGIQGASVSIIDSKGTFISSALTGQDGYFYIDGLKPGFYSIIVSADGYESAASGIQIVQDATTPVEIGLNSNPGTISGTVSPIAPDTQIFLYNSNNILISSTTLSPTGDFLFNGLPSDNYIITALAPNYSASAAGVYLPPGGSETVSLTLSALPSSVSGIVQDSTGNPIVGAVILVQDSNQTLLGRGFTDMDGKYSISSLPEGALTITASSESFSNSTTGIITTPGSIFTNIDFILTADPGSISGQVRSSATGDPINGATVVVRDSITDQFIASIITDVSGNYQFNGLTPGSYTVTASAAEFGSRHIGAIVSTQQSTIADIILNPLPGSIDGVVETIGGMPITGTNIQITLYDQDNTLVLNTVANSDGTFTLPNLEARNYYLKAAVSGYNSLTIPVTVNPGAASSVILQLESVPVIVNGSIYDTNTSQGISGAAITFINEGGGIVGNTITDQDGTFVAAGLPYGTLTLVAAAANYGSASLAVFAGPGDTVSTQLGLQPNPGTLTGFVSNIDTGTAIPDATIQVTDSTNTIVATVQSNEFGEYVVNGLAPGTYSVNTTALGYGSQSAGAMIESGTTTILGSALTQDPGFIAGTVNDQDNPILTIPGAFIIIREMSPSGTIVFTTSTDANGLYNSNGLKPGTYFITASAEDYGSITQASSVLSNQTTTSDFLLPLQQGGVSGQITDSATMQGLPNTLVRAIDNNGSVVQFVQTDSNGNYLLNRLVPGNYTIVATNPDYQANQQVAAITANSITTADIPLNPLASTITGLITETGTSKPLVGTGVELYADGSNLLVAKGLTDGNGQYLILGVPEGNYRIIASLPGYATSAIGVSVPANASLVQDLSLASIPANISGIILDGVTSQPISGALVSVIIQGTDVIIAQSLTDEHGEYLLSMIPDGTYNIVVSAAQYSSVISSITLSPAQSATYNTSLAPFPGSIQGTVIDNDSLSPLANALVQVFFDGNGPLVNSVFTNALGTYELTGFAEGSYNVVFSANGYGSQRILFNLGPAEIKTIDSRLSALPATLTGTIREASSQSTLSGSLIQLFDQGSNVLLKSVLSDSNGYYVISGIGAGNYRIVYSAQNYQSFTTQTIFSPGESKTIDVTLDPAPAIVQGNVTDSLTTLPIQNARVDVVVPNSSIIIKSGFTNELGDYTIPDLPTGSYVIVFTAPGYISETIPVLLEPNSIETVDISLLDSPATIAGQVTDPAMVPIPNALVQVFDGASGVFVASQFTDGTGQYTISNLAGGQYQIVFTAPGFTDLISIVSVPSGGTLSLDAQLDNVESHIYGTVVNELTNTPIFGALVQVFTDQTALPVASDITDNLGRYDLFGLPPGTYTITISSPGFGQQSFNLTIKASEVKEINIALTPSASSISGTVANSITSTSIPGVSVSLVIPESGIIIRTVQTAQDGSYLLDGVMPGSYQLLFSGAGFANGYESAIILKGESLVVNKALDPVSSIVSGSVFDTGSNPLAGVLIQVFDVTSKELIAYALSDQAGNYQIDTLPAGTYNILASKDGYVTQITQTTVPPNQSIDFQLDGNPSTIEGTVVDTVTNRPIQGALLQAFLNGSDQAIASYLTDPLGRYYLSGLPAGTYVIRVTADGYRTREITVTIGEGETIILPIRLNPVNVNLCQLSNFISLQCRLSDQEGNPIAPEALNYQEISREDINVTLPSGGTVLLQKVRFILTGYIQFILVTTGSRCVSAPIMFTITETVIVCAPDGTDTDVRIDSLSCKAGIVCVGTGNAVASQAALKLAICASFFSTAPVVITLDAETCSPRGLIEDNCGTLNQTQSSITSQQIYECINAEKVYDWIQLNLSDNIQLGSNEITFTCSL
ncbi:carboxypeptidase regulatory-like domain-containing protein [Falsibacillus pallidus]|uniref:carboxypeptidase regulatory-like domain-containing protein n=1 Tax=Falsibacillus pallidus TaxID=493781 RepID=UPI003D991CDE